MSLLALTLYQHWTKISNTVSRSMQWPERRCAHAATCVSGPLLVILGGATNWETMTSDCWIYDFITMLWKKVLHNLITVESFTPYKFSHFLWMRIYPRKLTHPFEPLLHILYSYLYVYPRKCIPQNLANTCTLYKSSKVYTHEIFYDYSSK